MELFLFFAWVLLVSGLTLTPQPPRIQPPPSLCILCGEPDWGDILANVLLFVPAGIIFARRGVSFVLGVAIGLALSAAIELAQLWVPGRYPSLRDVVVNGAGVAVGALLYLRLGRSALRQRRAMRAVALAVPLGVAMYTGWIFSPIEGQDVQYSIRVPDHPPRPPLDAEFIDATIGGQRIASGEFRETDPMRSARTTGDALALRFLPRDHESYPVLYMVVKDGTRGEILYVSVRGKHVLVRRYGRGTQRRSLVADAHFTNFLVGPVPTDTMTLRVRTAPRAPVCAELSFQNDSLAVGASAAVQAECAHLPALGAGWRLVLQRDSIPEFVNRVLDGLGFVLLLLPVAILTSWRGRWAPAAFVVTTSIATSIVGHLVGLAWMGLPEGIAVLTVATLATRLARHQSHPSSG